MTTMNFSLLNLEIMQFYKLHVNGDYLAFPYLALLMLDEEAAGTMVKAPVEEEQPLELLSKESCESL